MDPTLARRETRAPRVANPWITPERDRRETRALERTQPNPARTLQRAPRAENLWTRLPEENLVQRTLPRVPNLRKQVVQTRPRREERVERPRNPLRTTLREPREARETPLAIWMCPAPAERIRRRARKRRRSPVTPRPPSRRAMMVTAAERLRKRARKRRR